MLFSFFHRFWGFFQWMTPSFSGFSLSTSGHSDGPKFYPLMPQVSKTFSAWGLVSLLVWAEEGLREKLFENGSLCTSTLPRIDFLPMFACFWSLSMVFKSFFFLIFIFCSELTILYAGGCWRACFYTFHGSFSPR